MVISAGREEEGAKVKDKKRMLGGIVKYIVDHPRFTLFIAGMVKKTERAFGELAGSVEAILTLFFLSVTGLRPVDPACKGLSGNLFCPQDKWLQQLMLMFALA